MIDETRSVESYRYIEDWVFFAFDLAQDIFGEDESLWKNWEQQMTGFVSKDSLEVFQTSPSASKLHYHSNGLSDDGKIKTFIDEFDDFQDAFLITIGSKKHAII